MCTTTIRDTVADAAYPGLAAADGTGTNRAGLLGRGLPLMNTPPSWLTLPWPRGVDTAPQRTTELSVRQETATRFCKGLTGSPQVNLRRPKWSLCSTQIKKRCLQMGRAWSFWTCLNQSGWPALGPPKHPISHSRDTKKGDTSPPWLFLVMLYKYWCDPLSHLFAVCIIAISSSRTLEQIPELGDLGCYVGLHHFNPGYLSTNWA